MTAASARAKAWTLLAALLLLLALAACESGGADGAASPDAADGVGADSSGKAGEGTETGDSSGMKESGSGADASGQPVSYDVDEQPGTVFYEIFVRAFYDTDGDGIGDLNGVTAKLDYLQELGIGGIWLTPINASPSYHGYDVTDYYAINPEFGTLEDFKRLLAEAEKRDIKVLMDLVVNHSSSEHPWFKDAVSNAASPYRNWYHIAGTDESDPPKDSAVGNGNPWHSYGSLKYLGVFWSGMPDFNLDEPEVREEMIRIGRYWLDLGVDGFRLDAAKHVYGDFMSTVHSQEVKDANQKWWQEFRAGLLESNPDTFLIGEVWDSASTIAPFLDEALDSAFNFDLAGRMMDAASREQDPDLAFTLGRVYGAFERASGGKFVDAPFLSNHDQNRVMSVLRGNVDHAKMAAGLLLTLPGHPFLYYGEEIGMQGMKPDEYIREPMLWYSDPKGGEGQTKWVASRHNKETGDVSVEAQLQDDNSLLGRYRQLIAWRNEEPALRDGGINEYKLDGGDRRLSAFVRMTASERVLVIHNLSGETISAALTESGKYGSFSELVRSTGSEAKLEGTELTLPPYSTVIIK